MSRSARRTVLGALTLGAAAVAAGLSIPGKAISRPRRELYRRPFDPVPEPDPDGLLLPTNVTDGSREIQGYASATSVNAGDSIDFHVTVARPQPFTVTVYRIGHYAGAGSRLMKVSEELAGSPQPIPAVGRKTGLIDCEWPVAWTLRVPADWSSGLFLAVFESRDGHRASTPFVVREDRRRADFLLVLPFTTYAAYNMWPLDGRTGKSLYRGYRAAGSVGGPAERAYQVSFNRPYSRGGRPKLFALDVAAAQWLETNGYDVAYASGVDLHEGRIDPDRYRALVFSGHDEYWSSEMRDVLEKAFRTGTHCAFLGANNVYWNIRLDADRRGRAGRVVTCYKEHPDPTPGRSGPTMLWRNMGEGRPHAEARLLGVQYNGIPKTPVPLVVREAGHWLWAGTGVRDGDRIRNLVGGEADGHDPVLPLGYDAQQVILSNSPYTDAQGRGGKVQNTSLCVTPKGTIMFAAGTFHWPLALVDSGCTDARIQRATRNLFDRMRSPSGR
ncbi:N,N-dimethylformamidase beta subunit family domain-containing protein [Actinoplanes regularis]|uniref:N,N-dimethylformamidase beta subunit family domain-containing protein n=1 Tax=Actinoplanes regularis TaxID=52697 RepID=UPI0024A53BBA|nr:N,N-dimethylformamidase beta subunit family domain-containing protein [Actinoplanes regularis]GLW28470.1 hypothetical protein Areg01_14100 [Actinoplanes regularis]